MTEEKIEMIEGGVVYDDRGSVTFVNNFSFQKIKRFYQVENLSPEIIRAFHGHEYEEKYVFVSKGSIKLVCAKINQKRIVGPPCIYTLNSKKPSILKIPKGFANGFKVLKTDTVVIFFSTSSLEESKNDDLRFDWDIFGKEIWEIKNR